MPQENTNIVNCCVSEDELELEQFISDAMEDINGLARGDSLADELTDGIERDIQTEVERVIEHFKDKERWGIIGKEKELHEAVLRLVGTGIISKLQKKIFPEE